MHQAMEVAHVATWADSNGATDSVVESTQREEHDVLGEASLLRGVVRSVRRMGKRLAFVLVHVGSESVNCLMSASGSEARMLDIGRTEEETNVTTSNSVQATRARNDTDTRGAAEPGKTAMASLAKLSQSDATDVTVEPHEVVQVTVREPEWIRALRPGCVVTAHVAPERGGVPSSRDGKTVSDGVGGSRASDEKKHSSKSMVPANDLPAAMSSGSAPAHQRAQYECVALLEITNAPEAGHDDDDSEGQGRQANGSKRRRVGDTKRPPTPPCRWFLQGKPCPVDSCARRHFFTTAAEQRQCEAKRSSAERMRSALVASVGT